MNAGSEMNLKNTVMWSYKQIPKKAKCPICAANDGHLLWDVNSEQAAQHFVLYEESPDRFDELVSQIENLWGQNTCQIVQCDQCGFCYSDPYVAGDERFYTLAYTRTGYPKWKWEYQVTYDVLLNILHSNATLIEIGAGNGAFIKKITENILPKENILCTEYSEYGKSQIEEYGVRCLSKDIRDLSNAEIEEGVDVICMFQVLEHMDKLDALFAKLNSLLKQGGSLFVSVPNHKKIEYIELNGALMDMPPNHIGRWNYKCFELIGKQHGFRIEDYKVEDAHFFSNAKQFVIYRFLRSSQQSGSLSNVIQRIRNKQLKRIAQVVGVVVHTITALPVLAKMGSGVGNSQWVHLIKD